MKVRILAVLLALAASVVVSDVVAADDDFYVAASKSSWDALTANQKQKAKAVVAECTTAPVPLRLQWGWTNSVTGELWGIARYRSSAGQLKQKAQMDATRIQRIKNWLNDNKIHVGWTNTFEADIKASKLVPIRRPPEGIR